MSFFDRVVVKFLKGTTETAVSSTEPLPVAAQESVTANSQTAVLEEIKEELVKMNFQLAVITEIQAEEK